MSPYVWVCISSFWLTDTKFILVFRSFSEGDGMCSAEVFATEVVVTTNAGNHNHGSSKVKLKNLVDYNWEPKFYPGQLLAIHMSGKYLAYSIKGKRFFTIWDFYFFMAFFHLLFLYGLGLVFMALNREWWGDLWETFAQQWHIIG